MNSNEHASASTVSHFFVRKTNSASTERKAAHKSFSTNPCTRIWIWWVRSIQRWWIGYVDKKTSHRTLTLFLFSLWLQLFNKRKICYPFFHYHFAQQYSVPCAFALPSHYTENHNSSNNVHSRTLYVTWIKLLQIRILGLFNSCFTEHVKSSLVTPSPCYFTYERYIERMHRACHHFYVLYRYVPKTRACGMSLWSCWGIVRTRFRALGLCKQKALLRVTPGQRCIRPYSAHNHLLRFCGGNIAIS